MILILLLISVGGMEVLHVERRRRGGSSAREERSEALGKSDPNEFPSAESAFLRDAFSAT